MSKILEIFKQDIKSLLKSKIAMIITIGIIFIPGIYAWLNIDSNWGPYDNTGNLPIAVVNKDDGVDILDTEVNIGNEIEKKLKSNNAMKWVFTSEDAAKSEVEKGKYYGSIIIPEDFSKQLTTLIEDGKAVKPTFDFYVNDKKNPIAPIIVNKAVGTIQTSVNQAFASKIFYKLAEKAEGLDVSELGDTSTAEVISNLDSAKSKIQDLRLVVQTTGLTADTASKSLSAVKKLLPKMSDISNTTKQDIADAKKAAQAFTTSSQKVRQDVESIISGVDPVVSEITANLDEINISNTATKLEKVSKKAEELQTSLKRLDEVLKSVTSTFSLPNLQNLESKVAEQIAKLDEVKNLCDNLIPTPADIDNIRNKVSSIKSSLADAKTTYYDAAKAELIDLYSTISSSIDNTADSLLDLNISLDNVDSGLAYTISALTSGRELANNFDTVLANFQTDIDRIAKTVQLAKANELYNGLIKLLKNSPEDIADFLTSPVDANQVNLYEIETYGSKMAPFYSILACWVGCTILIAIMSVNVKESEITKRAKNYQKFFGRYLLFGLLAMCQGLVIGLGDIVLGVQTVSPLLCLFTLMLSSAIFVLIIYALATSMGKVGQALAIVIMVLQVAGSGGTFPIELLPRSFQLLQPFMPFYPAMNAVRETVGGFYDADYLKYICMLLCHSILPMLIGLELTKLTSKLRAKFDSELEETNLIG